MRNFVKIVQLQKLYKLKKNGRRKIDMSLLVVLDPVIFLWHRKIK